MSAMQRPSPNKAKYFWNDLERQSEEPSSPTPKESPSRSGLAKGRALQTNQFVQLENGSPLSFRTSPKASMISPKLHLSSDKENIYQDHSSELQLPKVMQSPLRARESTGSQLESPRSAKSALSSMSDYHYNRQFHRDSDATVLRHPIDWSTAAHNLPAEEEQYSDARGDSQRASLATRSSFAPGDDYELPIMRQETPVRREASPMVPVTEVPSPHVSTISAHIATDLPYIKQEPVERTSGQSTRNASQVTPSINELTRKNSRALPPIPSRSASQVLFQGRKDPQIKTEEDFEHITLAPIKQEPEQETSFNYFQDSETDFNHSANTPIDKDQSDDSSTGYESSTSTINDHLDLETPAGSSSLGSLELPVIATADVPTISSDMEDSNGNDICQDDSSPSDEEEANTSDEEEASPSDEEEMPDAGPQTIFATGTKIRARPSLTPHELPTLADLETENDAPTLTYTPMPMLDLSLSLNNISLEGGSMMDEFNTEIDKVISARKVSFPRKDN